MNRKLLKLLKKPKAFWQDSRWNINNKKIKSGFLSRNNQNFLLQPLLQNFDIEYLINQLQQLKVQAIYIKPIRKDVTWTIGIKKNQKKVFFMQFMSFLYSEDIDIHYLYKNKIKKAQSVNGLWSDISLMNNVEICLSTLRAIDGNQFWFQLEFWEEFDDFYLSPTANHISRKLWKSTAKKHKIFEDSGVIDYSKILSKPHEEEIDFDIDLVFTWVNSDDENWKKMYFAHKPSNENTDATSASRFLSRDELKYALRSWGEYGKFIRNIYIVSNCKPPEWLNLQNENIFWIYHEEIINEKYLPTFSSHAIETSLHKIKGLSNHFIYSNDDVLLVKDLSAKDFYYSNGIAKIRLEQYGMVNGEINKNDPDYLNAARNCNLLLEHTFQKSVTQLHTHSPQSMAVDVLEEISEKYKESFHATSLNKFRQNNDISVASYLYPHFALLSGKALNEDMQTEFIQQNHNFKNKLQRIISLKNKKDFANLPFSVCVNDGADSHSNKEWNKEVLNFLNTFFPAKSRFEL